MAVFLRTLLLLLVVVLCLGLRLLLWGWVLPLLLVPLSEYPIAFFRYHDHKEFLSRIYTIDFAHISSYIKKKTPPTTTIFFFQYFCAFEASSGHCPEVARSHLPAYPRFCTNSSRLKKVLWILNGQNKKERPSILFCTVGSPPRLAALDYSANDW